MMINKCNGSNGVAIGETIIMNKETFKNKLTMENWERKVYVTKKLLEQMSAIDSDPVAKTGHVESAEELSDWWEHFCDEFYPDIDIMWWHWDAFEHSQQYANDIRNVIKQHGLAEFVEDADKANINMENDHGYNWN